MAAWGDYERLRKSPMYGPDDPLTKVRLADFQRLRGEAEEVEDNTAASHG